MAQGHAVVMVSPSTDRNAMAQELTQAATGDQSAPQTVSGIAADGGSGHVDKIRDILFGSHIRDYESRFAHLEESLAAGLAEIRDTATKRFDAVETYVRNEFECFDARLKSEQDDRTESLKQIARDIAELRETLTRKIVELDEKNLQADRLLRLELLQLSKNVNEELRRKQDEAGTLLDRRFQELRNVKMDRAALATLLVEVATRLNGEFQVVGRET